MSIFTSQSYFIFKGLKLNSKQPQEHLGPESGALSVLSAFWPSTLGMPPPFLQFASLTEDITDSISGETA